MDQNLLGDQTHDSKANSAPYLLKLEIGKCLNHVKNFMRC